MDDFAQAVFTYRGRKIRFAAPDLVQIYPLAFNLRFSVERFLKQVAGPEPIEYVVDVGACTGTYAIPYAFIFPNAEFLCIEPSKYNFPFLEFNLRQFDQIRAMKVAAHNRNKAVKISSPSIVQRPDIDSNHDTGLISIHGEGTQYSESVTAVRLDDIVKQRVSWLKIDVEGNEMNVLEGAKRILQNDKPILQIEFREDNQHMGGSSCSRLLLEILAYNYVPAGAMRGDMFFRPRGRIE